MSWPTQKCGWCPATIIWARTAAGKAMPVDPEPDPAGNVLLTRVEGEAAPRATVFGGAQLFTPDEGTIHKPHFATCTGQKGRR